MRSRSAWTRSGWIGLWSASLEIEDNADLLRSLSDEERERAQAFRSEGDRRRYAAGRARLRSLLRELLDCPPSRVALVNRVGGKPALGAEHSASGLRFNLSHSGSQVVFAVTHDREVGVDLEQARPVAEAATLAERFFSARESEHILGTSAVARAAEFLRCWTRKEAVVKALGGGLHLPLDSFTIPLGPHPAPVRWADAQDERWTVADVDAPRGFFCAVAVEGELGPPVPTLLSDPALVPRVLAAVRRE